MTFWTHLCLKICKEVPCASTLLIWDLSAQSNMGPKVRNEGVGHSYLDHAHHVSSPQSNQPQKLQKGATRGIGVHMDGLALN